MKQLILFLSGIFSLFFTNNLQVINLENHKILIVYYSSSGNTEAIANSIHEKIGGDIVKLELIEQYPTEYKKHTEQAKKELADGILPPPKNKMIVLINMI